MNKKISSFFKAISRHIGLYLASAILVSGTVYFVSYSKTRILENEKFTLFFTSDSIDLPSIMEKIDPIMDGYDLIEGTIYQSSYTQADPTQYRIDLMQYGVSLSDFLLVPESVVTESFVSYNLNAFRDYHEDGISFGETSKVTYAVKVYDHEQGRGLLDDDVHYEVDEDYYLCISKNTFHYKAYLKGGDSVLSTFIDWAIDYGK